jgi:hypothetical protein
MTNEVKTSETSDVRMDGDMVIAGLSERTREAYRRAVRQLAMFHRRADPGTLEEQHVNVYLLWLRTEKRAASGTLRGDVTCITQLTNARDEHPAHKKSLSTTHGHLEHRIRTRFRKFLIHCGYEASSVVALLRSNLHSSSS